MLHQHSLYVYPGTSLATTLALQGPWDGSGRPCLWLRAFILRFYSSFSSSCSSSMIKSTYQKARNVKVTPVYATKMML